MFQHLQLHKRVSQVKEFSWWFTTQVLTFSYYISDGIKKIGSSKPHDKTTNKNLMDTKSTTVASKCPCLVICGPSGVGKGTIMRILKEKYPSRFIDSVSFTTRQMRPGEQEGVNYYYVSKEEFNRRKNNGEFLEVTEYSGNFYGTSKTKLQETMNQKKIPILDIAMSAALKISKQNIDCKFIFLTISGGIETLRERLKKRGTETSQSTISRLQAAKKELKQINEQRYQELFDKILTNDDLDAVKIQLFETMTEWYPWLNKLGIGAV